MAHPELIAVQQGVWIHERWLRDAGLGQRLQVEVQPGEIRIRPAPQEAMPEAPSEAAWEVFRSLGRDAKPGRLKEAAAEHDRYLYGKEP